MDWINLVEDRDQRNVGNRRVSQDVAEFLSSWATGSFWRKTQLHGVIELLRDMFAGLGLNYATGGIFYSEAPHFISNSIGTRYRFQCVSQPEANSWNGSRRCLFCACVSHINDRVEPESNSCHTGNWSNTFSRQWTCGCVCFWWKLCFSESFIGIINLSPRKCFHAGIDGCKEQRRPFCKQYNTSVQSE
jgi:hypothetical protein